MPTYSYECKRCRRVHQVFHPITASPRVKCPECGGSCKRLLGTGAAIIFKGSGFYETDYKKAGGKDKPAEKAETPKTEAKKESAGSTASSSKAAASSKD